MDIAYLCECYLGDQWSVILLKKKESVGDGGERDRTLAI